ncbi:MAG: glycerophosphodiester phosphodiesterase [Myxococcota bacterium]
MGHPFFDLPLPLVIGHRGCAGEVPENTLASFEAGLAAGAVVLESDVHLTRDGVPVLIHDDGVDRVTQGTGRVAELDLDELQRLDAGHRFELAGGHPFRGQGLKIPTLSEALERFPGTRFNLELKEEVPGIVDRSVATIAAAGAAERTLLNSENGAVMQEIDDVVAETAVPVARGASRPDVLAFLRAALDGAPPPAGPMALQVPAAHEGSPLVTEAFVSHAHRHDIQVHVWTINEPDEMTRLLDLGVDGLVTDFPRRLADLLRTRSGAT